MSNAKLTAQEQHFLKLHQQHGLSPTDLAQVFAVPYQEAKQVLQRATAKNDAGYVRLLEALCEGRR